MKRLKDINAERIVRDENGMEVYGRDLDGNPVWVWVHLTPATEIVEPEPERGLNVDDFALENLTEPKVWESREFWQNRTGLEISPERWTQLIEFTVEKNTVYS